eukprot:5490505-Amphidinium_carterae.1
MLGHVWSKLHYASSGMSQVATATEIESHESAKPHDSQIIDVITLYMPLMRRCKGLAHASTSISRCQRGKSNSAYGSSRKTSRFLDVQSSSRSRTDNASK